MNARLEEEIALIASVVAKELKPLLNSNTSEDHMMDTEGAASFLGTKKRWLENNAVRYGIPRYKIGGHVRYKYSDLLKWVTKQRVNVL